MTEFFQAITAMPTVLFTVPLGLACLYWLMVMVGALDMDVLDLDSALEGAAEGLEGALGGVDGAVDGALDGAIDGASDAALDGAAEAVDGALDGAAEGAGEASGSLLVDLINALHLRDTPMTVSLSFLVLFAWVLSYLGMSVLGPMLPVGPALAASVVGLGAFAGGTFGASLAVRPLARFFVTHEGHKNRFFVGSSCQVTTGRVDDRFGQASIDADGNNLIIQVRCREGNALKKGDEALIVRYDRQREVFVVEPLTAIDS